MSQADFTRLVVGELSELTAHGAVSLMETGQHQSRSLQDL